MNTDSVRWRVVLVAALAMFSLCEGLGLRDASGMRRALLTSPTAAQKQDKTKGANNNMASSAALGTAGSQGGGGRNRTGPAKRVGFLDISGPLTDIDPEATCNDGSPAYYYIRRGFQTWEWLVYLEGGLWCYDQNTCALRFQHQPWLMSSNSTEPQVALGGLFESGDKSPFGGANVIYLPYCTSDGWAGDAAATEATWGFSFRGARVVAATIAALVRNEGLGSQASGSGDQEKLLLAGCSAGSRGAMFNLDYIPGILEAEGVKEVQVRGLLDSPLWIEYPPYNPIINPLSWQTQQIFPLINSSRLGAACADTFPNVTDQWQCLFGQFRMPMLTVPYMLNAAQFDKFQLPYNVGGNTLAGYVVGQWHPAVYTYADGFQQAMVAVVDGLPTKEQKQSAVFSSGCFRHCVTDSAAFWNVAVEVHSKPGLFEGSKLELVSLRDAIQKWYFESAPEPYRIVSNCSGFRCGQCTTKAHKALQGKEGKLKGKHDGKEDEQQQKNTKVAAAVASLVLFCCGACCLVRLGVGANNGGSGGAPGDSQPLLSQLPRIRSLRVKEGVERFASGTVRTGRSRGELVDSLGSRSLHRL